MDRGTSQGDRCQKRGPVLPRGSRHGSRAFALDSMGRAEDTACRQRQPLPANCLGCLLADPFAQPWPAMTLASVKNCWPDSQGRRARG
jgi:hypothetical protein